MIGLGDSSLPYLCIDETIKRTIMKNHKQMGQVLSERKMKTIKGGYVFSSSEYGIRCPLCGERAEHTTYTYYITCRACGNVIHIKEKENEASI